LKKLNIHYLAIIEEFFTNLNTNRNDWPGNQSIWHQAPNVEAVLLGKMTNSFNLNKLITRFAESAAVFPIYIESFP